MTACANKDECACAMHNKKYPKKKTNKYKNMFYKQEKKILSSSFLFFFCVL